MACFCRCFVFQKITDIYATSIDYDPTLPVSIDFFKTVQNKMRWAITGWDVRNVNHYRRLASLITTINVYHEYILGI